MNGRQISEGMPPIPMQASSRVIATYLNGDLDWRLISTAPYNRDVELRTADRSESFCLPFPCRHTNGGWINSDLGTRVNVEPTHWRVWPEEQPRPFQ
jgi:hypothetical protein